MRPSLPLIFAATFVTLNSIFCIGQISSVTNQTLTPVSGVGHEYIGTLNETVNPSNGSLSLRLNFDVPQSRGLTLPFGISYDSAGIITSQLEATNYSVSTPEWYGVFQWHDSDSLASIRSDGWGYSFPYILAGYGSSYTINAVPPSQSYTCSYIPNLVYVDPAGTRHTMGILPMSNYGNAPGRCGEGILSAGVDSLFTVSQPATGNLLKPGNGPEIHIYEPNGTHVQSLGGTLGNDGGTAQAIPINTIEDANGNYATYSMASPALFPLTYTDSSGRQAVQAASFGSSSGDAVTVSGLQQPYTLSWQNISYSSPLAFNTSLTTINPSSCGGNSTPPSGTRRVLKTLTLPNGKAYQFTYDSLFGFVQKIVYPNGGYVRYTWGVNSNSDSGVLYTAQLYCIFEFDSPAITDRYVSNDGTTEVLHQHFTYSTSPSGQWTSKTTNVVDTDYTNSNNNRTTVHTYTASQGYQQPVPSDPNHSFGAAAPSLPVESETQIITSGGTLVSSTAKTWNNFQELTSVATTLGSLTKLSKWNYNAVEQETERDDYDFGSGGAGPLLRKRIISYTSLNPPTLAACGKYAFSYHDMQWL